MNFLFTLHLRHLQSGSHIFFLFGLHLRHLPNTSHTFSIKYSLREIPLFDNNNINLFLQLDVFFKYFKSLHRNFCRSNNCLIIDDDIT